MRSRTMGVTGKKVEKLVRGSRLRTMAGARPTDLPYDIRGLPAAYGHPGSLDPHEPCRGGPRVTIIDTIRELLVEAREERRYSERRMGTDMEDIVVFCEGTCRKRCHLRVPAEELDDGVRSSSNGTKAQRYRKCGSPKPSKEDGESAMEMMPNPTDSEGYHTCYPLDGARASQKKSLPCVSRRN